jgi:hypothetical protein
MKKILLLLFLFKNSFAYEGKGGLLMKPMSKDSAQKAGYIFVSNSDSLIKYASIANSKIFIEKSFSLTQRCSVATGVNIQSDKKSTITSKLWFNKYRFYESFTIIGSNVTLQGLILRGDNPDILTLDYLYNQTAIRVVGENFHIINCDLINWGWASVYFYRYQGAVMEQCYCRGTKSSGYGYVGAWFEGTKNQYGIIKDCIFEEGREAIDAGGQLNSFTITGNVAEQSIGSHVDANKQAGIGVTATNNYCVGTAGIGFPYPRVDTGWVTISNNYFLRDRFPLLGSNPRPCKIDTSGNHYLGEGMNLPTCTLRIDSVYTFNGKQNARMTLLSVNKICQINFGDGSEPVFVNAGSLVHAYPIDGSYTVTLRCFDGRGIPSLRVSKSFYVGKTKGFSFAIKTTARFLPIENYFKVQFLIDDSVIKSYEASNLWRWKKCFVPFDSVGIFKVALRIICVKDCPYSLQFWADDFSYMGQTLNCGFDDYYFYQVPYSYWKQTLAGIGGSGQVTDEKCGGAKSWHFEARTTEANPITTKGRYSDIYNYVTIK